MENVLNAMRRENDARVASLPPGYRETAQRMGKRLEKSDLSPFAVEDIRREIVGMAIEAQGSGQTLEEFLGNDEAGFCADVIYHGKKRTMGERLAVSLPVVAWVAFAMLVAAIAAFRFTPMPFSLTDAVVTVWFTAYILYFSTYPKKRLVTVLWWVVMLYWYLFGGAFFYYPMWVRIALQLALFAVAYWNRYRVYSARAAEYGWNGA